jgi:hypothetical protein
LGQGQLGADINAVIIGAAYNFLLTLNGRKLVGVFSGQILLKIIELHLRESFNEQPPVTTVAPFG